RRLGGVDEAPAREVDAREVAVTHVTRAVVVGEVGQPGERSAMTGHRVEEHLGIAYPVKRRDEHQRYPCDQGDDAARDQSSVMIERHPAHDHIVSGERYGSPTAPHLVEDGLMGESHALL